MNQLAPAISNGWLRRFGPDGTCKHCGEALPPERRFSHEACDQEMLLREQQVSALKGPQVELEELDELAELVNPTLLNGRIALDDPAFPQEDSWSQAAQRAAGAWEPTQGGLWIHGTAGSGKSTLLAGLVLRLRREGIQVHFTSWVYLLNALRVVTMRNSERYHELLSGLGSVPVLALDDLLIRPPTDWAKEVLYQVLDDRMNRHLPLLATSNLAADKVRSLLQPKAASEEDKNLAQRISSRILACVARQPICVYPGDRRTGEYDESLAPVLALVAGR